jgi:hypothetical protein
LGLLFGVGPTDMRAMDRWLRELRSAPEEGAVRGGERQARAAFQLVSRDSTLRRAVTLEALALTGLWAAFFLLRRETGSPDRDADRIFEEWLYWVSAIGIATVSSLAVACVVDAKIDGVEGGLRLAFDEVRRRLPALLGWLLISIGVGLALGFGTRAVMQPLPSLLVAAVIWGVGSLFVVPAIALQDGGPLGFLLEALRLLRARWGRALAGLFVIGFVYGLVFIGCGFMLQVTAESHPRTTAEPVWTLGGPLLLVYLAYALMSATRGSFAVILARDALGDLPGEPPAVRPRRRSVTAFRRVVFGLALLCGLIVVAALFFGPRSSSRQTTSRTYVPAAPPSHVATNSPASFASPFRDPDAKRLRPGAPVLLAGRKIGRVYMVHIEPTVIEVFYEVDRRREPIVIHSRKKVAMQGGRAYMVVVP